MCRPGASSTMDTGCSAIGVFFSCSSLLPTPSDRCAELWQAEMDEDGEEMMRMTMMINSATPIDGTTCPVDVRVDKGHCSPARPSDSARDPHGILVEKFSPHDHERQPGTAEKDDDDNDNHDDYTGATTRHSADMVMCSPDPHFQSNLGAILRGESSRPHDIPLQLLKEITDSFSDKRILGKGGVGVVYKGVLPNGEMIAVKRIVSPFMPGPQKQFESEVCHLMLLKHPNIVPFVGYCYERKNECVKHDGKYVLAELVEMLLCFEYLPNGSLDEYLSDESSGLDWSTRYKIIEGICYGLCHLHEQVGKPIIHLDLKPANILLDDSMVPKITDFGLSRLLDQQQTICTSTRLGTLCLRNGEMCYTDHWGMDP